MASIGLKQYKYRITATLWFITVFIASVIRVPQVPTYNIFAPDKLVHFTFYCLFTLLLLLAIREANPATSLTKRDFSLAIFLSFLAGFVIEIIQGSLLAYRSFDVLDLIANIIGIFVGAVIGRLLFTGD